MTTCESKGRFFLLNESIRIDSHNESNRIDSNRELECSTLQTALQEQVYTVSVETDTPETAGDQMSLFHGRPISREIQHHVLIFSSAVVSCGPLRYLLRSPVVFRRTRWMARTVGEFIDGFLLLRAKLYDDNANFWRELGEDSRLAVTRDTLRTHSTRTCLCCSLHSSHRHLGLHRIYFCLLAHVSHDKNGIKNSQRFAEQCLLRHIGTAPYISERFSQRGICYTSAFSKTSGRIELVFGMEASFNLSYTAF